MVWALSMFGTIKTGAVSTNAQSRFASVVVEGVLGPPRLVRHTWRCPCFSVVLGATHKASQGPLKGAVSSQKALQWSKTELLGGTEEKFPPTRGHWFASRQINDFLPKAL